MIEGMTIVSTGHTYPDMAVGLVVLGIVLGIVFVFSAAFASFVEEGKAWMVFSICGLVLSVFMFVRGCATPNIPTIKVILSPDVDMVELMQRYEVQSVDGQIWELVEKEQMK